MGFTKRLLIDFKSINKLEIIYKDTAFLPLVRHFISYFLFLYGRGQRCHIQALAYASPWCMLWWRWWWFIESYHDIYYMPWALMTLRAWYSCTSIAAYVDLIAEIKWLLSMRYWWPSNYAEFRLRRTYFYLALLGECFMTHTSTSFIYLLIRMLMIICTLISGYSQHNNAIKLHISLYLLTDIYIIAHFWGKSVELHKQRVIKCCLFATDGRHL